ncbi:hypothetical protein MNBD_CPR01-480 [hydrothermal vent metagenome]|uniref:Uncharacterized protein n=1 Tax=hydrothermal vent metagenome TaxID=652676 RepID=A0A3B0UL63_9ZZZZ
MSTGKRATCDYFSIIYTDKVSGYAIVVSKKIAKKAVTRHRIKRRVRSVLRNSKIAGRGCIIFARPGADKITFQDLNLEIQELLARVR